MSDVLVSTAAAAAAAANHVSELSRSVQLRLVPLHSAIVRIDITGSAGRCSIYLLHSACRLTCNGLRTCAALYILCDAIMLFVHVLSYYSMTNRYALHLEVTYPRPVVIDHLAGALRRVVSGTPG